MRTQIYEQILASMAGSDERAIYAVLVNHVGADNRISKEEIGRTVFGKYNTTVDRTIREHVENMRMNGHLICSDSGAAGYYLPANLEDVDNIVCELESRARRLFEESRMMKKAAQELFNAAPQMRMEI